MWLGVLLSIRMCLAESWMFMSHGHCSDGLSGVGSAAVRPDQNLLMAFAMRLDVLLVGGNGLTGRGFWPGWSGAIC